MNNDRLQKILVHIAETAFKKYEDGHKYFYIFSCFRCGSRLLPYKTKYIGRNNNGRWV